MTTPSKKLNDFLRANGRAAGQILRDQAAEADIPADRDLSPEDQARVAEIKSYLKQLSRS